MAARIPLTTAFTAPSDCLNTVTWYNSYYLYLAGNTDTCYPSSYTYTSYYSPATACPSGFTSYTASVITVGDLFETRAACCPTVPSGIWTGESIMYWYPSYSICTAWVSGTIRGQSIGQTGLSTISASSSRVITTGYTTVTALPVLIAYQESDRRTGARTTSASSASTGSSAGSSASSTTSPSPSAVPASGGLSTGAKIGIGVAVPLVVLAALFGLVFFIMKRRKNKQRAAAAPRREIQQEFVQGRPLTQIEHRGDQKYMSAPQSPPYQYSQAQQSDYGDPPRWSQHGQSNMGSSPELTSYAPSSVRAPRGA